MVAGAGDPAPGVPAALPGPGRGARFTAALARFQAALPALLLGLAVLRLGEVAEAWPPGSPAHAAWAIGAGAVAADLLALGRYLPLLFLLSWPLLALRSARRRRWAVGLLWSFLLLAQFALACYFLNARVVLGADLFAYSASEVRTAAAGFALDPLLVAAAALGTGACWLVLRRQLDRPLALRAPRFTLALAALCALLLVLGPLELPARWGGATEYERSLRQPKLAALVEGNLAFLLERRAHALGAPADRPQDGATSAPIAGLHYLDSRHPFLHEDETPDVLGPRFRKTGAGPPHLVIVIVEGLGRSFSGPGAELGSFTPFLDELAQHSLYFDNFLSGQGRTFAVLPTLLASAPYGAQGLLAMGERMPAHDSLLSILKGQGYRLRFFCGFDPGFDNEAAFLHRAGVDSILGRQDFPAGVPRISYWGYDDRELFALVAAHQAQAGAQPFVDVVQTVSMHDPYRFLGEEAYAARFEQRLSELGIAEERKGAYRAQGAIYRSILYTDDALRQYVAAVRTQPWYERTLFLITGDHRLPEIPISNWIDRYHVPLIIHSPLLKQPGRIAALSSQFDVAPSLLAFLAQGYGLRTPAQVAWIGSGLDLESRFRNVHELPLKQTKPLLDSFVSGEWALRGDTLYRLGDGLDAEPVRDEAVHARLQARFAAFRRANEAMERTGTLLPAGPRPPALAYDPARRHAIASVPPAPARLTVSGLTVPARARAGALAIDIVLANPDRGQILAAVPLAVLQAADGSELTESYGALLQVPPASELHQHLAIKTEGVGPGQYYLSVFPSDAQSGARIGDGRYHVPVVIAP